MISVTSSYTRVHTRRRDRNARRPVGETGRADKEASPVSKEGRADGKEGRVAKDMAGVGQGGRGVKGRARAIPEEPKVAAQLPARDPNGLGSTVLPTVTTRADRPVKGGEIARVGKTAAGNLLRKPRAPGSPTQGQQRPQAPKKQPPPVQPQQLAPQRPQAQKNQQPHVNTKNLRQKTVKSQRVSPNLKEILSSATTLILVTNFQYDFVEGPLATNNDTTFVSGIRRFVDQCRGGNAFIVFTQDWHMRYHISFATTHKKQPFSRLKLTNCTDGTTHDQLLLPKHCVQHTQGAKLLITPRDDEYVVQLGVMRHIDSYSAFRDIAGETTGLYDKIVEKGITHAVVLGCASDIDASLKECVKFGFTTICVQDLCRGVDANYDVSLEAQGATCVSSDACIHAFPRSPTRVADHLPNGCIVSGEMIHTSPNSVLTFATDPNVSSFSVVSDD